MKIEIKEKVSLKSLNTWKVGGNAQFFCAPKSLDELQLSLLWAADHHLPYKVLGGGSNILVNDSGIQGLVINTKNLQNTKCSIENERFVIEAEAGVSKSSLSKLFLKQNLDPALFLMGIPGFIAGGIVMNAGIGNNFYPNEFAQITDWIETVSLNQENNVQVQKLFQSQINWSYRNSTGWNGIISKACFSWPNKPNKEIKTKVRDWNKERLAKQPLGEPSAGSVFKNPNHHQSAGFLIENSGLKGFQIGGAQVSTKHANFILNTGNASSSDITELISYIQKKVFEIYKIQLETEIKLFN